MRSFLIIAVVLTLFMAAPPIVFAGIDDSWDWVNDSATGKPKRQLKVFYNFTDTDKLGDKTMKAVMDEAIDNWNKVKDQTGWEFVKGGTKDDYDIEVKVDDKFVRPPGGAATLGLPKEGDKNRRVSKLTITFNPTPGLMDWDTAGKPANKTRNPVASAMHELSHTLRLAHQGGAREKTKKIKDPRGISGRAPLPEGLSDAVVTVSKDDIEEARVASTAAIRVSMGPGGPGMNDVGLFVPGFPLGLGIPVTTMDATLSIPSAAFLNDVDIFFSATSLISMPDPLETPPDVERMVKGIRIDITGREAVPELNPQSFFTVTIPYEDGLEGDGFLIDLADPEWTRIDEAQLRPFIFDPISTSWDSIDAFALGGSFFVDTTNDFVAINLPVDSNLFHELADSNSPNTLSLFLSISGAPIPEPSSLLLLGAGCLALFRFSFPQSSKREKSLSPHRRS